MTPAPAPPVNAWILDPIHQAVVFIAEEAKLGGLLKRSLIHIENGRPLLELAARHFIAIGKTEAVEPVRRLLSGAPLQEQWAQELRVEDYAALNAHSLVAIWGSLEVCVEDVVVAILANRPEYLKTIADAGVRVDPKKMASPPSEEDLRLLFKKIEDHVRVKYDVVATQDNVLNLFGLSAACDKHKDALLRANALRNAIVHRAGYVDEKAIEQAPSLHPLRGTKCKIGSSDYANYHDAVGGCLLALMGSVVKSSFLVQV